MKKQLLCLILALASCGKNEVENVPAGPAAAVPSSTSDTPKKKEPPPPIDKPEELKKLQGQLPRLDPEKAKFIAVPSTPPDPEKPKPAKAGSDRSK